MATNVKSVKSVKKNVTGPAPRRYRWRMPTTGKLELTIKINALPTGFTKDANGWVTFWVDCDGVMVWTKVRPKMWKKLEDAARTWPLWVAAIAGKMGERTQEGFELEEPSVQAFERKAKAEATPTMPTTEGGVNATRDVIGA